MGVKVRERPEGSGIYWVMIDHQGKRKSKKIGKDKTTANKIAKKIEAKLVLSDLDILETHATEQPNFEEYAKCWLEDYIKPLRRPSTYERYRDILERHVFPTLGKKPIDFYGLTGGMVPSPDNVADKVREMLNGRKGR